jgi:hypothetical protein
MVALEQIHHILVQRKLMHLAVAQAQEQPLAQEGLMLVMDQPPVQVVQVQLILVAEAVAVVVA